MNMLKTLVVGFILAAGLPVVSAQVAPGAGVCPAGGPAWKLTPEERAARQQQMQSWVSELRAKRDNGSITENEQAWLTWMEQRGGLCVNGVPRGAGYGKGGGPRDGTGPRAQMGQCPLAGGAAGAKATPPGRGFGRGQGMRNGTGPRAQAGNCPLVAPPTAR